MESQLTFTDCEYSNRRKTTKREKFLESMNAIIPWASWVSLIEPFYFRGEKGRKPMPIETMLRMYLMQNWFGLSDEGIEDSIYDSYAMRKFMGIDFSDEQVPDATTLLRFRHMLEEHEIAQKIFADVRDRLDKAGLMMHGGSIVDATIIKAPSSTKNKDKSRDTEMRQTKKGSNWHFGMKIHSGVDAGTGYVHTITATAANVHDITETRSLVRDDDHAVYADSGYLGIEKRAEIVGDEHLSKVDYRVARRPSQNKLTGNYDGTNWDRIIEHEKSSIRCKVEHPFHIVKNVFHACKTRYKGIKKNFHMFNILFASANLLMCSIAGRQRDFCPAIV